VREAFLARQRSTGKPVYNQFLRFSTEFDFLKAKGTATPSIAVTLIENLPDKGNPRRAEEDTIAKNVAAVAYAGMLF